MVKFFVIFKLKGIDFKMFKCEDRNKCWERSVERKFGKNI